MDRNSAVLITLLVYKLLLIGIGLIYQRQTRDGIDFFLAGRRLGPVVASISASASSSSAWTLLGVSGAAYAWGLSAVWLFPACVGGFLLNWYGVAPHLQRLSHRTGALTMTEVLAGPQGTPRRARITLLASAIIVVSLAVYVASQFQGAGKTFSETFQLPLSLSILLGSGVVILYTLLGGFWAVSVTDTVQGSLMALTAVVLPAVAFLEVGGLAGLLAGLQTVPQEGFLSLTRSLPAASGAGFVLGLLGIGLGYPGQPHVVNRFMALQDRPGALAQARRLAVAWAVVVYAGMLLLGWCGRILYPGLADPEVVFITATNTLFPPVLSGVFLAAVLSAIMSTADSQLLVAASALTHDLGWGNRWRVSLLSRSRLVVLWLSGGAVLAALYGSQEIFSRVLFAWAAMGCAFGPLLLVLIWRRTVSPGHRLAAMAAGFSLSVTFYYLVSAVWSGTLERVLPFLVALAVAWHGSGRGESVSPGTSA